MLEYLVKATPPESESVVDETISRKDLRLAWLAGLIDGEGCITAYIEKSNKNKTRKILDCRIKVTNTDMRILKRISEIYVENKIGFYFAIISLTFRSLEIIVSGKGRIRKLIALILPYLVGKRKQAMLLLELYNYRETFGYNGSVNRQHIFSDKKLLDLVSEIKREKKIRHNPLQCSRQANKTLGIPRDYTSPLERVKI